MIEILKPHDTLKALYKAILQHPAEDTPRLQFADCCEEVENPHPAVPAWGKFIKAQYALEVIGKPRYVLEGSVQRSGSDYYRMEGDADDPVKVGDRVDVKGVEVPEGTNWDKTLINATLPGLLVIRIVPTDAAGATEVILKRDAESRPFPEKERAELETECRNLFRKHRLDWFDRGGTKWFAGPEIVDQLKYLVVSDVGPNSLKYGLEVQRGFVSRVRIRWTHWRKGAKVLTSRFPITIVSLLDPPIYSGRAYTVRKEARADYYFAVGGPKITLIAAANHATHPDTIRRKLLALCYPTVTTWEFPAA